MKCNMNMDLLTILASTRVRDDNCLAIMGGMWNVRGLVNNSYYRVKHKVM